MAPQTPYYAVIFTSLKSEKAESAPDYSEMARRMVELASKQPGFIGVESARNPDGSGITVSYWESLEAIQHWRDNLEHLEAQRRGREEWYRSYSIRVARVERESVFES